MCDNLRRAAGPGVKRLVALTLGLMMLSPPLRPPGPTLADDTPCRRCGYNLRSLPESGKCPECATPVALSLRGDLLKFADPAWVRSLALGAAMVMYSAGAILIAFVAVMISAVAGFPIYFLLTIVVPAAGIAAIVGQWLLTMPDPSASPEQARTTGRAVVRWLLIAALVIAGLEQLAPLAAPITANPGINFVTDLAVNALKACWVIAYLRHLAWLCDRIPDAKLARISRRIGPILVFLGIAAWAKQFIPGIGAPGVWASTQSRVMVFIDMFFGLLTFALLGYALRALALNSRIAKRLRTEARSAAANWPEPPTSPEPRQSHFQNR